MKMKVYMFGHYDSRGGTIAIVVSNHKGQLESTKRRYNEWMGWSEEEKKHVAAGGGRMADNVVADLLYPGGPAQEDYLWPAELEYDEEKLGKWERVWWERIWWEIDLEDMPPRKMGEGLEDRLWWVITEGRSPEEQIAKYGWVRLKVIERPEDWEKMDTAERKGFRSCELLRTPYGEDVVEAIHPGWDDDAFGFVVIA